MGAATHVIHEYVHTFETDQSMQHCVFIIVHHPMTTKMSVADAKTIALKVQRGVWQHVTGLHSIANDIGITSTPHQGHGVCKVPGTFARKSHEPVSERIDPYFGDIPKILFHSRDLDVLLHDV